MFKFCAQLMLAALGNLGKLFDAETFVGIGDCVSEARCFFGTVKTDTDFDQTGVATTVAADVRKIRITMTGTTTLAHPQTKKTFGQTVSSDIQIATR